MVSTFALWAGSLRCREFPERDIEATRPFRSGRGALAVLVARFARVLVRSFTQAEAVAANLSRRPVQPPGMLKVS
jgi:hypothetical protein